MGIGESNTTKRSTRIFAGGTAALALVAAGVAGVHAASGSTATHHTKPAPAPVHANAPKHESQPARKLPADLLKPSITPLAQPQDVGGSGSYEVPGMTSGTSNLLGNLNTMWGDINSQVGRIENGQPLTPGQVQEDKDAQKYAGSLDLQLQLQKNADNIWNGATNGEELRIYGDHQYDNGTEWNYDPTSGTWSTPDDPNPACLRSCSKRTSEPSRQRRRSDV